MRVLFNTYPAAFDCPGGGEIQLLECKAALERLGVEVLLYDQWNPQFEGVDAVHYFSVQGGSTNFCEFVKRKKLPLLISPILWPTDENISEYPMQEIRSLLNLCDVVLPNSAAEIDQLGAFFDLDPQKCVVVTNGVGDSFTSLAQNDLFREHLHLDGPFLLNVANIEPRKNQLTLVQAVQGMDLTLVLLGRVREAAYFEECMRKGSHFVRYGGFLPHVSDLLKSAYRASEVFVLPSLLETPGLAALEAATQEARLVLTSVGSTREYFQDLVTYVNPYDPADIRAGIEAALGWKRDESLRRHVLQNFTWDHAALILVEAYKRAAYFTNAELE
ncbi:MAG: glycosyltransferase family 4 protein [Desulfomonilaceae bacterium]